MPQHAPVCRSVLQCVTVVRGDGMREAGGVYRGWLTCGCVGAAGYKAAAIGQHRYTVRLASAS